MGNKTKKIKDLIENVANAAREGGQKINIFRGMPTISIDSIVSELDEFFLQEHEATEVLNDADKQAEKFGVSTEDYILYIAQSW